MRRSDIDNQVYNAKSPLVSVIMSVFNAEKDISEAIESICNQTFKNFEFIIINDGSTDKSLDIIKPYVAIDKRIKLINRANENKGLIYSLNEGISISKGIFLARMDADDICHEMRLSKQLELLHNKKDVGVVSCNVKYLEGDSLYNWPFFNESHENIVSLFPFHSPIVHAAVMIRRCLLSKTPYNQAYPHAEDYKLWTDLSSKTQFYNLKDILYFIRIHHSKVSVIHNQVQVTNTLKVIQEYLRRLDIFVWNEDLHRAMITSYFQKNNLNLFELFKYLDELKKEMRNPSFDSKTNWIKAIFMIDNTCLPKFFIFYVLLFHIHCIRFLTFKQFLSLLRRSLIV